VVPARSRYLHLRLALPSPLASGFHFIYVLPLFRRYTRLLRKHKSKRLETLIQVNEALVLIPRNSSRIWAISPFSFFLTALIFSVSFSRTGLISLVKSRRVSANLLPMVGHEQERRR
jgi:hypothetical protein